MFSFLIGLAIAVFITVAGFGGFLFKLSNIPAENPSVPNAGQETEEPLSEVEAEAALSLNEPASQPDFRAGS